MAILCTLHIGVDFNLYRWGGGVGGWAVRSKYILYPSPPPWWGKSLTRAIRRGRPFQGPTKSQFSEPTPFHCHCIGFARIKIITSRAILAIDGPVIYTALNVTLFMRANPLQGQMGVGWALEIKTFLALWNGIEPPKVPFGAQEIWDTCTPPLLFELSVQICGSDSEVNVRNPAHPPTGEGLAGPWVRWVDSSSFSKENHPLPFFPLCTLYPTAAAPDLSAQCRSLRVCP